MTLDQAQKILLIAPHRLGDTLFATPGIRVLRQAKPKAQIDALPLSRLSYEVLKNNSCIDKIYHPDLEYLKKITNEYEIILPLQNIKKINSFLQNTENVLMLPRYSGSYHYSENFYRFIQKNLQCAKQFSLGEYELNFSEEDEIAVKKLLNNVPSDAYLIALHMGCHKIAKGPNVLSKIFPFLTTTNSRSWSFKRFNQLIQKLLKTYPKIHIILTGSDTERYASESLLPHSRLLNFMGLTNVTQLAALLSRCKLLLTGDTGPMHVASAVNLPMVLLCGETNPNETGPHPQKAHHTIIYKKGMKNISVEETYDAIQKNIKIFN